jgi:alkanesulfonate monooxygenase SsuD/methylene tetrahydromethanopterin reductase-like flavin-dependent oxidoreductase (luciferase family)
MGEHVAMPVTTTSVHPTRRGTTLQPRPIESSTATLLDPLVVLGGLANVTRRLTLGTCIYIMPLHHPLAAARAAATVHELSSGRLMFGVGAGWRPEEFAALEAPFEERFSRLVEGVEIVRRAWEGGPFHHHGVHYRFEDVRVTDGPLRIPVLFAGNTESALQRAVRLADGWIASEVPSFENAARLNRRVGELLDDDERRRDFRRFFRVEFADADLLDRYVSEDIEDVMFLAHDVCGLSGDPAESLRKFADRIGVVAR